VDDGSALLGPAVRSPLPAALHIVGLAGIAAGFGMSTVELIREVRAY
jgi:hypothetical protein